MDTSVLEIIGSTLAILYLGLVGLRRWIAWPAYIVSSVCYIPIFWRSHLYCDAALQIFFVAIGLWGWVTWRSAGGVITPITWTGPQHRIAAIVWVCGTVVIGSILMNSAAGGFAFPDAFIMVGSVIATFMTLGRVVENWWYWVIINLTAVITYGLKELWVTVGLYGVYSILSVWGLMAWRRAQAR